MAETYKNLKFKLLTPWHIAQQKKAEEEAKAAVAAGEPCLRPPAAPALALVAER